jgi:hypothetical protein
VFAGGVKLSGASRRVKHARGPAPAPHLPSGRILFTLRQYTGIIREEVRMARRTFCIVAAHWTASEVQVHRCYDGSHAHVTREERNELLAGGLADWLIFPRVLRLKGTVPLRGLSCKVGAYLASQVQQGRAWARVMVANVTRSH